MLLRLLDPAHDAADGGLGGPDDGHRGVDRRIAPAVPAAARRTRPGGTLDGRLITVTGFTLTDAGRTDLARVVIICCAADARLTRIRLAGPAAAQAVHHRDETWLSVEGMVRAGQGDSTGRTVPVLEVSRVQRIAPPANPYAD